MIRKNSYLLFILLAANQNVVRSQTANMKFWIFSKRFVIPPKSKIEKNLSRNRLLEAGWLTNFSQFQGTRPDHVRVESCCFPRELVSFVHPWELVSFDPRHVIRSPPSENVFELKVLQRCLLLCCFSKVNINLLYLPVCFNAQRFDCCVT